MLILWLPHYLFYEYYFEVRVFIFQYMSIHCSYFSTYCSYFLLSGHWKLVFVGFCVIFSFILLIIFPALLRDGWHLTNGTCLKCTIGKFQHMYTSLKTSRKAIMTSKSFLHIIFLHQFTTQTPYPICHTIIIHFLSLQFCPLKNFM